MRLKKRYLGEIWRPDKSTSPLLDIVFTDCRLLEGGRWHGLLSQAHASICHCYAKHCFGIEEIELRSRPSNSLVLIISISLIRNTLSSHQQRVTKSRNLRQAAIS